MKFRFIALYALFYFSLYLNLAAEELSAKQDVEKSLNEIMLLVKNGWFDAWPYGVTFHPSEDLIAIEKLFVNEHRNKVAAIEKKIKSKTLSNLQLIVLIDLLAKIDTCAAQDALRTIENDIRSNNCNYIRSENPSQRVFLYHIEDLLKSER